MYIDAVTIGAVVLALVLVTVLVVTVRSDHKQTSAHLQSLQTQLEEMHASHGVPSHASREMCCAIRRNFPNAVHGVDYQLADDGEGPYILDWMMEHPQPAQHELDQWIQEYRDDAEDNNYRELRRIAYPSIQDQLDALYKARQGNTGALEQIDAKIARVKEKYPKPEHCSEECEVHA